MSIRKEYEKYGVEKYYKNFGNNYVNPHFNKLNEGIIKIWKEWNLPNKNILDLACGSGEISLIISKLNCKNIIGCDPFTCDNYFNNTKNKTLRYSFDDITAGKLTTKFKIIVCSYAMHLIETSKLPNLLFALSSISNLLLIVSPHKKPIIKNYFTLKQTTIINRIHFNLYTI